MEKSKFPTDAELLDALSQWDGRSASYVVRNRLLRKYPDVTTAQILRALKQLEREGKVYRAQSSYAVMIVWALAHPHVAEEARP